MGFSRSFANAVIASPRSGRGNASFVPAIRQMDCFAALAMMAGEQAF
jgi:hypothetical protein